MEATAATVPQTTFFYLIRSAAKPTRVSFCIRISLQFDDDDNDDDYR